MEFGACGQPPSIYDKLVHLRSYFENVQLRIYKNGDGDEAEWGLGVDLCVCICDWELLTKAACVIQ